MYLYKENYTRKHRTYNCTATEKRRSLVPSMLSMKVVEDFPSLLLVVRSKRKKNRNLVVLAEGCNVIMMANICTGKMSGRMAWTTRKHTEERNIATRERRGAVDRRNLRPWPLYTLSVYYSLRKWTTVTINSVTASHQN